MAMNLNHHHLISSFALGLSSSPFLPSPSSSNFRFDVQIPRARTFGFDQVRMMDDRTVTVAVPVPGSDFTVTEFVRTTRFITSTSTMDRLLRFPRSNNQAGFSAGGILNSIIQPQQLDQVRNPLLSINHDTMNGLIAKKEPIFSNPLLSRPIPTSLTNFKKFKIEPVSFNPSSLKRRRGVSLDLNKSDNNNNNVDHRSVQPADVVPNDHDKNSSGYDGRTHSLPNCPEGTFACPTCMATFNTSQKFASHVKGHYSNESEGEKKRRLDAKYKRKKKLRVSTSDYGLSVVIEEAANRRNQGRLLNWGMV